MHIFTKEELTFMCRSWRQKVWEGFPEEDAIELDQENWGSKISKIGDDRKLEPMACAKAWKSRAGCYGMSMIFTLCKRDNRYKNELLSKGLDI